MNERVNLYATAGSRTERGGVVSKATGSVTIDEHCLALVGDVVTYPDGSEAVITDGAGFRLTNGVVPYALEGSGLSNGDRVVEPLQRKFGVAVTERTQIEGLFDPAYVVPPPAPSYRLAVAKSTTARGGVLRRTSGWWEVDTLGRAAAVGDAVSYADGSIATIISGLHVTNGIGVSASLAFVGSRLNNGDVISDSPERRGLASAAVSSVVVEDCEGSVTC
ncbi:MULTISPECIES: PAAR domain-containing protein [unclassified Caballeronia]|uniref:PAAR domain-containing protein n=1 Tax=unclassified Caballeronia TaxID=2646786 RepID=UPI0028623197|nr:MULTISPECIES: PAAR domain-containing protein [unclassified Caballeronia]MDR5736560.1 PAAR domain-containing protein [Caballeronia sp. LZ016]MDR5810961.1 PAAR domain-containing protein [Caballeronia sp. LZ019]